MKTILLALLASVLLIGSAAAIERGHPGWGPHGPIGPRHWDPIHRVWGPPVVVEPQPYYVPAPVPAPYYPVQRCDSVFIFTHCY